jgi:hypothetical protein
MPTDIKKIASNKSGQTGVYWSSRNKKRREQIRFKGTRISLGLFDTIEEAAEVYNAKYQERYEWYISRPAPE